MIRLFVLFELLRLHTTSCLSPMIPPRFDNFCEQVVGAWSIPSDPKPQLVGEIEEVMRSCGGAVQGVRDIPAHATVAQEQESLSGNERYFNRADDGFIYFDCGSFTQGPIEDYATLVGSVSFSTIPKCRVAFDNSSSSWQALVRVPVNAAQNSNDNDEIEMNHLFSGSCLESEDLTMKVQWGKEIICRMPSSNQQWMLQRAKWQQSALDTANIITDKSTIEPIELSMKGWMKSWEGKITNSDGGNWRNYWGTSEFDETLLDDTSKLIQFGAICENTGEVKSLLRSYDQNGMLKAVLLQQGKL